MKKGKVIFGIIVGLVAVAGGVVIYRRMKASGSTGLSGIKDALLGTATAQTAVTASTGGGSSSSSTSYSSDGFPLKKGSRGKYVMALQQMLISKYGGRDVLPRYGADGSWGNETEAALKAHNLPTVINSAEQLAGLIAPLALPK